MPHREESGLIGVSLKFGHEDHVAENILDEARSGQHDTIVMVRHGRTGVTRISGGGVIDRLLHDAKGFAIWIVE